MAECATGKVYLAYCSDAERRIIIEGWKAAESEAGNLGLLLLNDDDLIQKIRSDGYAIQFRNAYNAEPGKTSSLAIPLFNSAGGFVGSLPLIYFARAMKPDEATARYLAPMQACATAIAEQLVV